ncbi:MAG: hypothetical protein K9H26_19465 [Prolixibacteraceae bacterium]|nr:hypothetical protein [Prolixibacteraceae bacterium]
MGKIEIWKIYGIIVLIYYLNIILSSGIISDDIYVNTYSGQLSSEMIAKMLSIKSKYAWLNYLLVPTFLVLKTGIIALCFWVGSFI